MKRQRGGVIFIKEKFDYKEVLKLKKNSLKKKLKYFEKKFDKIVCPVCLKF